ncbi:MAG: glycoside hydrolase family 15 protein [Bacteroidales bacterium]|nr:glycoside hydrolase family 15 protein [Bacteroidales bacterium]MBN2819262.1 glycoside hydrolase family 15 protein [Bacteroidales bacterium]
MNNLNFGVIGNCNSAALVSCYGSIEWSCLPHFDSSSIFAGILDKEKGGHFSVTTDSSYKITQKYLAKTNILLTKYRSSDSGFNLIDFMPRYINGNNAYYSPPDIIRYIQIKYGQPKVKIEYNPKLEYARHETISSINKDYIKSNTKKGDYDSVYLYTNLDKQKVLDGSEIVLKEDSFFLLSYHQKILPQSVDRAYLKYQRTKVYWMNWVERTHQYKKYNEEISRSALVLKLLSFQKSGAILAAITTSLPETIGEIRNWDYRFCWVRDASMAIKVLTKLGHLRVAREFMNFIINIIPDKDEKIQIMYGINGQKTLTEQILHHLSGYKDSFPVRIGNAAYKQKQNDIYGILMDVIYQQFELYENSLENNETLWTITRSIVKIVDKNWRKADRGIWEIRTEQRHFTFSKVLCWVAIDRAIKIASLIKMDRYIDRWEKLADTIKTDVIKNAWNEDLQCFTQYYGSSDLDASTLLMEYYGFIEASDIKFINTVLATKKHLTKNGLMYRYKNKDDFGLPTSSFTICTFWLINSLYKIGEKKDAREIFEKVLTYSNHVGLFSEDIDFESKRLLGNFPQAYSHLALIETAINLSEGELTEEEEILNNLQ